jgi:hypothetical protein
MKKQLAALLSVTVLTGCAMNQTTTIEEITESSVIQTYEKKEKETVKEEATEPAPAETEDFSAEEDTTIPETAKETTEAVTEEPTTVEITTETVPETTTEAPTETEALSSETETETVPETTPLQITEAVPVAPTEEVVLSSKQKITLPNGYNQSDPHNYYIYADASIFYEGDVGTRYSLALDTFDKFSGERFKDYKNGDLTRVPYYECGAIYTSAQSGSTKFYDYDITTLTHGWNYLHLEADNSDGNALKESYDLWYYLPYEGGAVSSDIGVNLEVFDWQNKERVYHGVGEMLWDDDLYTIAAYRAYEEENSQTVSHDNKLTTGENISNSATSAMSYFNELSLYCSAGHRITLLKEQYVYGAIARYKDTTVFVYETADWHARLDNKVADIRATYGDMFDVKE